ncbi:MAG: hypothetical protein AAB358_02760 [Patescibacteria group bacterium]
MAIVISQAISPQELAAASREDDWKRLNQLMRKHCEKGLTLVEDLNLRIIFETAYGRMAGNEMFDLENDGSISVFMPDNVSEEIALAVAFEEAGWKSLKFKDEHITLSAR